MEGSQVITSKNRFLSLKIDFVLANSAAFHLVFTVCQNTRKVSCLQMVKNENFNRISHLDDVTIDTNISFIGEQFLS